MVNQSGSPVLESSIPNVDRSAKLVPSRGDASSMGMMISHLLQCEKAQTNNRVKCGRRKTRNWAVKRPIDRSGREGLDSNAKPTVAEEVIS